MDKLERALKSVLSGEVKLTTNEKLTIRSIIEKRANEQEFEKWVLEINDGDLQLNEKELSYFK